MKPSYDVIVIGSGAGGGMAAHTFATAGQTVLVVEKGRSHPDLGRDYLRNHRNSAYGHNTGPDLIGNPRVIVNEGGYEDVVLPHQPGYNNNASVLGGGTAVFGAQAWRFHPLDFKMAATYGVPEGSSLSDWPISYSDLEPYYERIEHQIGVSGGPSSLDWPNRQPYPMEPLPMHERGLRLKGAADRLGWANQRVPLMINSEPYAGRPPCQACHFCVGFACPNHSRADGATTLLLPLAKAGKLDIAVETTVLRIIVDGSGAAVGVELVLDGKRHVVGAKTIVVACGAIESARLLLNSAHPGEPRGMGNEFDHVGRHLQGHYYPGCFGRFDFDINPLRGPGPTVSVTEFNHGNEGFVGGGMLADDFTVLPSVFARDFLHHGVSSSGYDLKDYIRENYRRVFRLTGPVHEIPNPNSRITLAANITDYLGLPVAKLSGVAHEETLRTAELLQARAMDWMHEAGAKQVWPMRISRYLSAGQHQAGTCRMSARPEDGVVDAAGRLHSQDNVLVCDTSVHVTNGGFNPFLTAMACSLRTAELAIARQSIS